MQTLRSPWLDWSVVIICLVCSACSPGAGKPTDGDRSPEKPANRGTDAAALDGCDAIDLPPPAAGAGVQVSIDMTLAPGQERQVCKLVMTPAAVNLNWAEGIYTAGSHHALLARTSYRGSLPTQTLAGDTVAPGQTADCETVGSDWDAQGVIAGGHAVGESPSTTFGVKGTLPDDVALEIAGDEVLELNFHMSNTSDHAVHACYKQNLYGIPDAQVKREAGIMFYYDSFITVPANGAARTTMACPVTSDVTLAAQVSHMHRRGDAYSATLLDGDPLAGGSELMKLYEGTDWEEPVVRTNAPPLALKTGQWVQWSCHYTNHEARNVAQGQQTTDEMCMFIGLYWPRSPEMDWCKPGGNPDADLYSAARFLGDGRMNGSDLVDCWSKSPQVIGGGGPDSSADRYATQRCFSESCAKVTGHINELAAGTVDPATLTCD